MESNSQVMEAVFVPSATYSMMLMASMTVTHCLNRCHWSCFSLLSFMALFLIRHNKFHLLPVEVYDIVIYVHSLGTNYISCCL